MTKPPAAPVTETITIYEEAIAPERLVDKEPGQESGKDQTAKLAAAEPAPPPVRAAAPKAEARSEPRHVAAVELPQHAVRAPAPVVVALPPSVVVPPAGAPMVAAVPPAQQPPYQHAYPQPYPQYQQPAQPQVQPPYAPQAVQPPPPVIMATPQVVTVPDRVVTVPDRPVARPVEVQGRPVEIQAEDNPVQPPGMLGRIVNTLKPSSLLSRAKEFGDRIEQVGNDILPSIRQ